MQKQSTEILPKTVKKQDCDFSGFDIQPVNNTPSSSIFDDGAPSCYPGAEDWEPPKPKDKTNVLLSIVIMLVVVVGLSWIFKEFVFQGYLIPSASMEKTLMTGDLVFAEKVSRYFKAPERGDIITFKDPNDPQRVLIKRVIATSGQVVEIKNDHVYINGKELHESYTNGLPTRLFSSSDIKYPYTVPQDYVWVMGDNRTNSLDSRSFGAVSITKIEAHAVAVYWSQNDIKWLS